MKVGRKHRGAPTQPKGANVSQTRHPSKHRSAEWGKTVGLHKTFNKNSSYPRAASANR